MHVNKVSFGCRISTNNVLYDLMSKNDERYFNIHSENVIGTDAALEEIEKLGTDRDVVTFTSFVTEVDKSYDTHNFVKGKINNNRKFKVPADLGFIVKFLKQEFEDLENMREQRANHFEN